MPFPYAMRPGQDAIVRDIVAALSAGRDMVFEAGTGTGKTVCSLASVIYHARRNGKKVVYLTRTNSQQRQVMEELRALRSYYDGLVGIALQGRSNMCPMTGRNMEFQRANSEELSSMCRVFKEAAVRAAASGRECLDPGKCCLYINSTREADMDKLSEWFSRELPTAEEAMRYLESKGLCPYEVMKRLIASADVVAAPYIYMLERPLRDALLGWMRAALEDIVIIYDEAHNLPDTARMLSSAELSINSLDMALSEAMENGFHTVAALPTEEFITALRDAIYAIRNSYLADEDGFVPESALETELMERFSVPSTVISRAAGEMVRMGENIRERKLREKKLPRSYLYHLGAFLKVWMTLPSELYVRLVVSRGKEDENPHLELFCLDPSTVLDFSYGRALTVHMSGTLRPIDEYRDTVGLPEGTMAVEYPSPFPPENRRVVFVDDVTTQYEAMKSEEGLEGRIRARISEFVEGTGSKNAIVLFPSYSVYDRIASSGFLMELGRRKKLYLDTRGMPQRELMAQVSDFKEDTNALLVSVLGGRLSEGIDFPDRALEAMAIVGIPYPKPTARQRALENFYQWKFGRGWEYAVKVPAERKILQAIGRLIRTETDRGYAVILDRRAVSFRHVIPSLERVDDLKSDMKSFFRN